MQTNLFTGGALKNKHFSFVGLQSKFKNIEAIANLKLGSSLKGVHFYFKVF